MLPRVTAPAWPKVSFEAAALDATGGNAKLTRSDYQASGALPVIDQGQSDIAGYTDDLNAAYTGPLPVVLFGDHTRSLKYTERPFALGADGVKILVPQPGFSAKYLYYFWLGAKIPSLGYSRHFRLLRELEIPKPDLREQARIVELLDQADALRRQRTEADAKLARLLPALFRHHFGDLARNERGWKTTTLGELTEIASSLVTPSEELLDLPHIGADRIEKESGQLLPANTAREDGIFSGKFLFDERDVLYCKIRPYLRKVALPSFTGLCSADVYPLRPKQNRVTREYLWQLLLSQHFTAYTSTVAGRANMPKINQDQLFAYQTIWPTMDVQLRFTEQAKTVASSLTQAAASAAKLETLFQTLLHRAFTGELTARWREAHLCEGVQEMTRNVRN